MIAFIEGKLIEKSPGTVVLLQSGVGFLIEVSMSTYYSLPELNANIALCISTQFRDDAIRLFGFQRKIERDVFETLLTVNRIGPKAALSILSGLEIETLVRSIISQDIRSLSSVSGIGKKTAERIVFELKDKVSELSNDVSLGPTPSADSEFGLLMEVISICENLGYKRSDIEIAAKPAVVGRSHSDLQQIIRKTLKTLSGRGSEND